MVIVKNDDFVKYGLPRIKKLIAEYAQLELIVMGSKNHFRIWSNETTVFIDFWTTGRFRSVRGEYLPAGKDEMFLREEIVKLATEYHL